MQWMALGAIAYLLTGIALTSYDFAAPAKHRKAYVISRDMRAAFVSWFIWPYSASFEAYQESRLGRSGGRFMLGVVLVAVGLYLWVLLLLTVTIVVTDWEPLAYGVAVVVGAFSSPLFAAVLMPRHGSARR